MKISPSRFARSPLAAGQQATWAARTPLLLAVLAICAVVQTLLQLRRPSIAGSFGPQIGLNHLAIAIAIFLVSLAASRKRWKLPPLSPGVIPWLSCAACLAVGGLAGTLWPNSGDEYSYLYLADTLLAGRLTNPPPPDPELFRSFRVFTVFGRSFSQYPPGWPIVLVPFRLLRIDWLANPILTLLLGYSLIGALRELGIAGTGQTAALTLVMLSPFLVFNGGSLFSHLLAATLSATIVWQQLADEKHPSIARKMGIGALFGALLLTRYEAFLILGVLYTFDRLSYRRVNALADAGPLLIGALPFAMVLLGYDWAVTGDPFESPAALTNPDMTLSNALGSFPEMVSRATSHSVYWAATLGQFGGFSLLVLQGLALVNKARQRSVRFYDLALPATILFFCYFPHDGGHQYGPRYWFFAWPLSALTVSAACEAWECVFPLGRSSFPLEGIACANLAYCALVLPGLLFTTRTYIHARRQVLVDLVPVQPALVLLPSRRLRLTHWQNEDIVAYSQDFTRNSFDFNDPVLYGRADAPDALKRSCLMRGRAVFIWRAAGTLARIDCHDRHP